ncbi:MAG: metallophosphoesterase [Candidatus Obscuribacterales bacterium]|nr:metallophosphoesterase [Candidatus Obscuribacterales bacterium]
MKKLWQDPRKRNFLIASAASLAAAGLGTYLYASQIESRRYRLDSIRVNTGANREQESREDELMRLRILHISDLHLSKPESHKLEFLKKATEPQYDLIVITGDIFEDYSGIEYADRIISTKPRLGAVAVLGNHDYFAYNMFHRTIGRFFRQWRSPKNKRDVRPMITALEDVGITVLQNSVLSFPHEKLQIIGIDYPGIADELLEKLAKQSPEDHLLLTLMHMPDRLERLQKAGVDLAFGGHTHGGQVRLPFFGPLMTNSDLPRHEASGLIWRGATAIHVSRGVGADPRTNFRLFCPPHGSIIEVCHRK